MTQEKKFVLKYLWHNNENEVEYFEAIIGPLEEFWIEPSKFHSNIAFRIKKPSSQMLGEVGYIDNSFHINNWPSHVQLIKGNIYLLVYTGKLREGIRDFTYAVGGFEGGELKKFEDITNGFSVRRWVKEETESLQNKISSLENDLERRSNNLSNEQDEWERKFRNKSSECEEYKEKNEELKERFNNKILIHANESGNEQVRHLGIESQSQIEIARLQEKSRNDDDNKTDLTRRLTDSENKATRLEISLTEKNRDIQTISTQLSNLRIENGNTQRELERTQTERDERITPVELERLLAGIENSQRETADLEQALGQSRESDLTERLRNKEQRLENFIHRLAIDWEQIQLLQDICHELVRARKDGNIESIRNSQTIIGTIKQNLLQLRVSLGDAQEICDKCEEIAQLNLQLAQQFEARVEVPTHF